MNKCKQLVCPIDEYCSAQVTNQVSFVMNSLICFACMFYKFFGSLLNKLYGSIIVELCYNGYNVFPMNPKFVPSSVLH